MASAAVVRVRIEPGSDPEHRLGVLRQFVVPEVRAIGGYVRSIWLHDGAGTGTCVVVFETDEGARAGLAVLTREGGPPVLEAGVHTVELEA